MSVIDVFYIAVMAFGIAIAMLVITTAVVPTITTLNATLGVGNPYINSVTQSTLTTFGLFDTAVVIVVYGLSVLSIILSFFVRSHPVFYIMSLIGNIIALAVVPQFSNAYFELIANPSIAPTALSYPLTTLMFTYLPVTMLIVSVLITIAMLGKGGTETIAQM